MLTPRQRTLFEFLKAYVEHHQGLAPTYSEMAEACDLPSKSAVHAVLVALEERGFIVRIPGRARAIKIVPQDSEATRDRLRSAVSPIVEYFGPQARLGQTCAVPASMILAMRDAL